MFKKVIDTNRQSAAEPQDLWRVQRLSKTHVNDMEVSRVVPLGTKHKVY